MQITLNLFITNGLVGSSYCFEVADCDAHARSDRIGITVLLGGSLATRTVVVSRLREW